MSVTLYLCASANVAKGLCKTNEIFIILCHSIWSLLYLMEEVTKLSAIRLLNIIIQVYEGERDDDFYQEWLKK